MKNWTFAKRLIVGFGLATTITAGLGLFAGSRLYAVDGWSKKITQDALPGVAAIGAIRYHNVSNLALVMEHSATEDAKLQDSIEAQIKEHSDEASKLIDQYEKTITQSRDRELFDVFLKARE